MVVKDANGCESTDSWLITQGVELLVSIDNPADILCRGDNDGSINANVTQESQGPYTYTLTGNNYLNQAVNISSAAKNDLNHRFTGLVASDGTGYKVTITNSIGCFKDTSAEVIGQPANGMSMTAKIIADFNGGNNPDGSAHGFPHGDGIHMKCNGQTNGQIDLNVTGGTCLLYTSDAADE